MNRDAVGRLFEFPATQAAASMTAPWDLRRKFGAMVRRRPMMGRVLHGLARIRAGQTHCEHLESGLLRKLPELGHPRRIDQRLQQLPVGESDRDATENDLCERAQPAHLVPVLNSTP